jgi:hypothetical protein
MIPKNTTHENFFFGKERVLFVDDEETITDMTMPKMTGARLSEKLMEIRPGIHVKNCKNHTKTNGWRLSDGINERNKNWRLHDDV